MHAVIVLIAWSITSWHTLTFILYFLLSKQSRPKTELSDKALYLYNPFARLHRRGEGTTFYNGRWNMYDNIIVSGNLLKCSLNQRAIKHYNIRPYIFRNAALLGQNGKPLPTYKGSVYMGGISDHLPIYIEIGLWYDARFKRRFFEKRIFLTIFEQ